LPRRIPVPGGPMVRRSLSTALLAAGLVLLPAAAAALDFFVNSTDDVLDAYPGDGDCFTGRVIPGAHGPVRECTLRAAVQEANGAPGFRFGPPRLIHSAFDA